MVQRESCPSEIGPINLGTKQTGALSAGNPHAGCDVAGAGNGFTVWLLRHSQRKRGAVARPDLRNTAPVLDPTGRSPLINRRLISLDGPRAKRVSTPNPVKFILSYDLHVGKPRHVAREQERPMGG